MVLPIDNLPQTHFTNVLSIQGIYDNRFVITIAPQHDICPHRSTYPTNAVAINVSNRITPMF